MAGASQVYFGDDFGQKIDLTVRIREILRNYPEGTSIFKELVQNADDAGATEVTFCLDTRHHGTDTLAYEKLDVFQGPSLLVYNNATFSEADFQSIQRLGDSLKKDTSRGWKTGRFGIGFNSVYHLTDLPAFVSGSHLVFFDPQACHLPNVNPSNPGKMINFVTHPDFVASHPDQLDPFRVFGCDFNASYSGTLFRLALRTDEQARQSRLSSRVQSPEHMMEMLSEFSESIHLVLLFLRNITKINLMKWEHGQPEPVLLAEASITNMNPELVVKRSLKMARISEEQKFGLSGEHSDFVLDIAIRRTQSSGVQHVRYYLANQLGGGDCSRIANDPQNASQRLVPWGGVAVRVPNPEQESVAERGLAFCFLPLPTHTYLPVHVNGYFELSSNRRDIWYGDGLSGDGLLRAKWNECLLRHVIAPCYARALLQLADVRLVEPTAHALLFPSTAPPEPWDLVLRAFVELVKDAPCLYTRSRGGSWISPSNALIVKRTTDNYNQFTQCLLEDDVQLVTTLSEGAEDLLVKLGAAASYMTPAALRAHYKTHTSVHAGNEGAVQTLLQFALRDVDSTSVGLLVGVQLLPLCNKTLVAFRTSECVFDTPQLLSLCSMGFSRLDAIEALRRVGGEDVDSALNLLMAGAQGDKVLIEDSGVEYRKNIYLPTKAELDIFHLAQDQLVDVRVLPHGASRLLGSQAAETILNIRRIDMAGIEDLFSSILPNHWFGKAQVSWTQEDTYRRDFDEEWFRLLWKYLAPSAGLRSLQDKWPLLPTESHTLCSLNSAVGVVSGELLPPACLAALTKLGVPVLLKNLFETVQPHTDVWHYVHQPTPGGVLSSLVGVCEEPELEVKKRFQTITPNERDQLRSFLLGDVYAEEFDRTQLSVLSKLPIFCGLAPRDRVVDSDVQWKARGRDEDSTDDYDHVYIGLYSAATSSHRFFCPGIAWTLLDESFLFAREHDEVLITALVKLGVPKVNKLEFFEAHLVPRLLSNEMPVSSRIRVAGGLLQELATIMNNANEAEVTLLIENAPIFPSVSGESKRVIDLFDPEINEFKTLMSDSFFPASELQDPQPLSVLRALGLQRVLSRRSILTLACSIESEQTKINPGIGDDQASQLSVALRDRAYEFFKYVDAHIEQLTSVTKQEPHAVGKKKNLKAKSMKLLRSLLGDINSTQANNGGDLERDFEANEERERQLAEQREIDDFVAKMSVIRWVPISHEKPLPNFPWLSDEFTIVASPDVTRLSKDCFLCSSQRHILGNCTPSTSISRVFNWDSQLPTEVVASQLRAIASTVNEEPDQTQSHALWPIIYDVYTVLSRFFESASDSAKSSAVTKLLSGDLRCVLVGRRFVAPHRVAMTTRVKAEPYLFSVPSELVHFRPFLKAIGVRERFSLNDFVDALRLMFEKSQPPLPLEDSRGGLPLSQDEVATAIGLVQLISDTLSHHTDYELFAPSANNVLMRTINLSFDDAPWLSKRDIDLGSLAFVHPKISNEVAAKIGAKSLRSNLLHATQSEDLFAAIGVEAFGQSEALTKRISHILEQYPDGPHIISELIQNADDAGASKVCLLYSDHTFGSSSILSPAMAKWQGPALYCYNDAEFKESDFISLARIGQAGKLQRVSTTGRFGLGFNSVYHFTDLPSVVSADSLVMFDPHATHLPGISPANPGIRVRFVNSTLATQFPDQFEPFQLFGCDMQHHFHGSLFRFPLRTGNLCGASEIRQRAYSKHEIFALFASFRDSIADAMVFLRNVRTVEVMIQGNSGAEPILLYSAEVPETERVDVKRKIDVFMNGGVDEAVHNSSTSTKRAFYARLARTPAEDLPSVTNTLHINIREVANVSRYLNAHDVSMVSACNNAGDGETQVVRTETLLVCNQIGGGRARDIACDPANESLKLIPWVGIAGRLHSEVPVDGRAFCFLPLPVRTGLPVHVNGYFELSSNRRDIWYGDDLTGDGKLRSEWNESLLSDAIAPAYATFLLEAKRLLCSSESEQPMTPAYLALFPATLAAKPWDSLVRSLYAVAKSKLVLTTSPTSANNCSKPIAPGDVVLVDERIDQWHELEAALNAVFIDTVRLPAPLRQLMTELNVVRGSFTPTFFRKLVRSGRLLPSLASDKDTRVIEFCLSDARDAAARQDLNGLPLIPVVDGTFKPLLLYSGAVHEPIDDTSLFFATGMERDLMPQFHHCLVRYEIKTLVDEIPDLFAASNLFRLNLAVTSKWFLPKILPQDWCDQRQTRDVYWWDPDAGSTHPSREWLQRWWEYAGDAVDAAVEEDPDLLQALQRAPLLPIRLGSEPSHQILVRVGESSQRAVLFDQEALSAYDWTGSISSVFNKLGVATVDGSIVKNRDIVQWLIKHKLLYPFDLNGFLSALSNRLGAGSDVTTMNVEQAVESLSDDERRVLASFVTSGSYKSADASNAGTLDVLPIFRVHQDVLTASDSSTIEFRALRSTSRLASEATPDCVLDSSFFVAPISSQTRIFLRDAQVNEWSFTKVLLDHVFPQVEEWQGDEHRQTLMDPILRDALLEHSFHQRQDSRFREAIRRLPIIPSARRALRRVCDLYDPTNANLAALVGPNSLPHPVFATTEVLDVLRTLGLRGNMSCHAILEAARSVEAMVAEEDSFVSEEVWSKASSLLNVVNTSFDSMASKLLSEKTAHAEDASSEDTFERLIADLRLVKWLPVHSSPPIRLMPWPKSLELASDMRRIASAESTRPESDAWMCSLSLDILSGQLESDALLAGFGWNDPVDLALVASQLVDIGERYSSISAGNESVDDVNRLKLEVQRLYAILDDACSTSDSNAEDGTVRTFVDVLGTSRWVWNGDRFLHLHQVALGAGRELEPLLCPVPPNSLVPRSLLMACGLKISFGPVDYLLALHSVSETHPCGMGPDVLEKCVKLFGLLADVVQAGGDEVADLAPSEGFSLVDAQGFLAPARQLVVDDMEWDESAKIRRGCRFVHKSVPSDVALALGAKSLHSSFAETEVTSVQCTCPSVEALKKMLPEGDARSMLFTEVVLAAERMGGTQVDFYMDHRKHASQRVIHPSFQSLQGASICIHIHGLVLTVDGVNRLYRGGLTRLGVLIGFKFTDCLQILSGSSFFVLDPASQYLPSSEGNSSKGTARCYDIRSEDFKRYPDQLLPFATLPSCPGNISDGVQGTLLRFPLRSTTTSTSSHQVPPEAMNKIAKRLVRQLDECLVFTESVYRVSVSTLGVGSEYAVVVNGEAALESPEQVLQRRNATRQNSDWKKKFSLQSLFRPQVIPENQLEFVIKIERDNKKFRDTWLLSDNVGVGRSRDLASTPVHETFGSIPYVSVAARIFRNGDVVRPLRGKLWKLVESYQWIDLPVHVTGCFRSHMSDKEILFDSPTRSVINDEQAITVHWNRVLLEDGVVEAYWKLLSLAKSTFKLFVPKGFYTVWPTLSQKNVIGGQIQSSLYRKMTTEAFFLCTDGQFRTLTNGYIVDYAGMDLQAVSFAQLHFPSFDIPGSVLGDTQRLLSSRVYTFSPKVLRRYLRNFRSTDLNASMCLSLLEYCLSDLTFPLPGETHAVWAEFQQLPLLPLQDGSIGLLGTTQRGRYVLASFNQIQLLHSAAGMFVSLEARQRLHAFFSDPRFVAQMGLSHFSIKTLADNVVKVLPAEWRGAAVVEWKPGSDPRHVTQEWLYRFWGEVSFERRSLAYFSSWCLIPVQGSRLQSCGKPDASICVWRGSLDERLRESLCDAVLLADRANEQELAAKDSECQRLRDLAKEKRTQEAADQFTLSQDEDLIDLSDESDESENESDGDGIVGDQSEDGVLDATPVNESDVSEVPTMTVDSEPMVSAELEDPVAGVEATALESSEDTIQVETGVVSTQQIQVDVPEFCSRAELHDLLSRLNVSMIDLAYFKGQETDIIPSGQGMAIAVLDCIWSSETSVLEWADLPVDVATKLAEYFSYHSQRYGSFNRMHIDRLKRLPIFKNISGSTCALYPGEHFLVPDAIDLATIPLPENAKERFMQSNPRLAAFYRELGVAEMSYPKLLMFVLPTYDQLSPDQCDSILTLIKERWPVLRRESDLVSVLRATPLFKDHDGSYRCASAFLDPRNKVLRTIYAGEEDKFPVEPLASSNEWLDLMAEIGLQSDITVQLFVECARRLEGLYSGTVSLSPQEEAKVSSLHSFFVQNFDKYDRARVFFDEVSTIRFVPATKFEILTDGSTHRTTVHTRTVLATYADCLTPDDQALAFTCMPILSAGVLPPRVLWSRLGLQSPPPSELVLQHVFALVEQSGGSSIEESWYFFQPVVEVFQQLFKFLQENWDRLGDSDRAKLCNTAIIPVGSTLVKGQRLFFHLAENLAPLMYEVPRVFGAYDTLFRRLGSKESPESEDYVRLLRDVAHECGDTALNLNELLSVVRIVGLLADALAEQNKTLAWETLEQLYLPSTDSTFRRAIYMAYNDAPWICARIDLAKLQTVHPRVSSVRCEALGIRGISHIVAEELEHGQLDVSSVSQQPLIARLNEVLQSQPFGDGLRTIMSVQHQKASVGVVNPIDFTDLHHRIVSVGKFSVQAVDTIRSRFIATLGYPSQRVDVTKTSTATGSMCFLDARNKVIYVAIKTLESMPGVRLTQVVAGCVNQLLGGFVHDTAMIESILSSEELAIPQLLRFLNVQEDPQLIAEKLRGTCGEQLSEQDMRKVELAPLRSFFIGELVAVEQTQTLVYGKIMVERRGENGNVNQFEVRIRQGESRWLPASQIFSFKSSRGHARATTESSRAFADQVALHTHSQAAESASALPAAVVALPGGPTAIDEGPVTTVMVMTAVNDLLSKVNMSLNSTYEELVAESVRLQQRLEQAEEARHITASQVDAALRKEKEAEDAMVCTICLEHKVDRVLIPCGHTYCSGCVGQFPRQSCPMCRQAISASSQFHFPS